MNLIYKINLIKIIQVSMISKLYSLLLSQKMQKMQSNPPQKGQRRMQLIKAELLAGVISGFTVSPLNVVIDKSVMQYTSGHGQLWALARNNLSAIKKTPLSFFTGYQFGLMYLVYLATYATSNVSDQIQISEHVSQPIQKLLMTFIANTTTGLLKDKIYAIKNGKIDPRPFPLPSYGLFFIRDIIAMASAFTIPPILSKAISNKFDISPKASERFAQIVSPMCIQIIATPIHLLALDIYNRVDVTFSDRVKNIKSLYKNALAIRVLRFLPAYGFGGIINTELRKNFKERVINE